MSVPLARVIPVYKSGSRHSCSNYRPISNLLTLNKIIEKLTFNRITSFLKYCNILTPRQFGFTEGKNITSAIFQFTSNIICNLDRKLYTICLFLDMRKAFDSVNHTLLLGKLEQYGFRGLFNDFLSSYLSNRRQYTSVNNLDSDTLSVESGVPQGSTLGPVLFNIFINDITNIGSRLHVESVLFADDAVFYISAESIDQCSRLMTEFIEMLDDWLKINLLKANVSKTKLMLFSPAPVNLKPDIVFGGVLLEWVTYYKYLGMIIDERLNYREQVNLICRKIACGRGVIYSLSKTLPQKALLNIYYSIVHSHVTMNLIIWGKTHNNKLTRVRTAINKVLRIICRVRYSENHVPMTRTVQLYSDLKLLQLDDLYKLQLLKFLHSIIYGPNSHLFNKLILPYFPSHNYDTREFRLNLPRARLDVERQSVAYNLLVIFNEYSTIYSEPISLACLTNKFKKQILQSYT